MKMMKNKIGLISLVLLGILLSSCNNKMCPLQDGYTEERIKYLYDLSDSFNNLSIKSSKPTVHSLFNGVVKRIITKDNKNFVFITSELSKSESDSLDYIYSNLEKVYVKEGDKVKKHKAIGQLAKEDSVYILVLSVVKGQQKLDPKIYIDCRNFIIQNK